MNLPSPSGSPLNQARKDSWLKRLSAFHDPPAQPTIDSWLGRFEAAHQDIAARVLDALEILSKQVISNHYQRTLAQFAGWDRDSARRNGSWIFSGIGSKSKLPHAVSLFREANELSSNEFDSLFRCTNDLAHLHLKNSDTIVFIDDVSGTGNVWSEWYRFEEMVGAAKTILILTAATDLAINRIRERTRFSVFSAIELTDKDNVFHDACDFFSPADKEIILRYCRSINPAAPKGSGACGLLLGLAHRIPTVTIPILQIAKYANASLFSSNL